VLQATDLVAGYIPEVNILNGCNLIVNRGDFVGIIGPNGAGKSTFLKAVLGLCTVRSGTVLLGGVAIQLQPGWKTYWRTPGDSGVPPRFDFSKSDNVEAVTVLWPAPKKFDDGAGGTALGYKQQVVLPLRIVAKNADKPVTLRAHVSYAVCDKLCIPVEAHAELAFASVASTEDGNLSDALNTVPKPANILILGIASVNQGSDGRQSFTSNSMVGCGTRG
jgi:DsbC/DsbD-like thiol-disulfide interchange protein